MSGTNPSYIQENAKQIVLDLLPFKSRQIYEKEYSIFIAWKSKNKINCVNEDVMLNYFSEKSKEIKPSTLWSKYSMLKAVLSVKENIDISGFPKLIPLLKRNATGYEPTKSKVLTREEINTFFQKADDETYLLIKVALIIGVCGACRREELHSIKMEDIIQKDKSTLLITIPDTKSNIKRVFPVVDNGEAINTLDVYQKYLNLRPATITHNYFFISYRKGKCTVQRVGIHTFGKMPSIVAEFLKLKNPSEYTGHCFRRSSASLAADADVDLVSLKRLGGWKSSAVAESYIETSIERKKKICRKILGEKNEDTNNENLQEIKTPEFSIPSTSGISFDGNSFKEAQNCSFHFHFHK